MSKDRNALEQVLHGAAITFVISIVGTLLAFVFKLLAARYFIPAEYGLYELFATTLGLLLIIANLGIKSGITRFLPYYKEKKQQTKLAGFTLFVIWIPLLSSLFASFLLVMFANQITAFFGFSPSFTVFLHMAAIYLPFKSLNTMLATIFVAYKKMFYAHFGLNIIERIVMVVGMLIIIYKQLSIVYLFVAMGLSIFLPFLFYALTIRKVMAFSFKSRTYVTKEWFAFSLPLLLTGVFAYILNWTDNFTIAKFIGVHELGVYAVSYSLANYVFYLPGLLNLIFLPILTEYHARGDSYEHIFKRIKLWGLSIALCAGAVLIIFPTQILSLFFGAQYAAGAVSLMILSLSFAVVVYFGYYYSLLMLYKDTMFIFYNTIAFSILNIILNIVFALVFGTIEMIALSSGLSILLMKFSEFLRSRKYMKENHQLIHVGKLLIAVITAVVVSLFLLRVLLPLLAIPVMLRLIISLAVYGLTFVFTFVAIKGVVADDMIFIEMCEKKFRLNLKWLRKLLLRR
ncbi:MAG: O-antigen/teichoic acid export membrane protein [Candidatus Woesearchaeota archaeon]|jgi:O-antigen/teichoic acid export membrane protein